MDDQRANGVVVSEVGGDARGLQHALDLLQLHGPIGIQVADRAAVSDDFSQLHHNGFSLIECGSEAGSRHQTQEIVLAVLDQRSAGIPEELLDRVLAA